MSHQVDLGRRSTSSTTLATNWNNVFEMDSVKSGEAEKDKIWALQILARDCSSYDLTIDSPRTVAHTT